MVGLARSHLGSNGRLGEPSLSNDRERNSKGDRKTDEWLGYILRSRVWYPNLCLYPYLQPRPET